MMYAPNPGEYASIAANQRVKREDEAMAIKSAMATAPILATDYQQITGAIPSGPVTDATEMVFVAGRAFVEASRHEQATGALVAERDSLRFEFEALLEAYGHRAAERDAARADLQTVEDVLTAAGLEREALVGLVNAIRAEAAQAWDAHGKAETAAEAARADVDTLLEVIATFRRALDDEGGASTDALYTTANTIRERCA